MVVCSCVWGFGGPLVLVVVVVGEERGVVVWPLVVVRYPPMERKLWIPSTVMNGGEGREAIGE